MHDKFLQNVALLNTLSPEGKTRLVESMHRVANFNPDVSPEDYCDYQHGESAGSFCSSHDASPGLAPSEASPISKLDSGSDLISLGRGHNSDAELANLQSSISNGAGPDFDSSSDSVSRTSNGSSQDSEQGILIAGPSEGSLSPPVARGLFPPHEFVIRWQDQVRGQKSKSPAIENPVQDHLSTHIEQPLEGASRDASRVNTADSEGTYKEDPYRVGNYPHVVGMSSQTSHFLPLEDRSHSDPDAQQDSSSSPLRDGDSGDPEGQLILKAPNSSDQPSAELFHMEELESVAVELSKVTRTETETKGTNIISTSLKKPESTRPAEIRTLAPAKPKQGVNQSKTSSTRNKFNSRKVETSSFVVPTPKELPTVTTAASAEVSAINSTLTNRNLLDPRASTNNGDNPQPPSPDSPGCVMEKAARSPASGLSKSCGSKSPSSSKLAEMIALGAEESNSIQGRQKSHASNSSLDSVISTSKSVDCLEAVGSHKNFVEYEVSNALGFVSKEYERSFKDILARPRKLFVSDVFGKDQFLDHFEHIVHVALDAAEVINRGRIQQGDKICFFDLFRFFCTE